jgi:Ca2+/Na+ antiporter
MIVQTAQELWVRGLTTVAFGLHIGGGTLALGSGIVAAAARKGGFLHRAAGSVFVASMLIMAIFAAYLAVAMPGQILNLVIAAFTLYLVATAWMTVKRTDARVGPPERIALIVALLLCAPFAVLSFQLATGAAPMFKSAVPLKGPVLVAIYGFTLVLGIAAMADARVVLAGGISGVRRIARHLWRMCLGLTLAAGSAFTNGLPRLLPGPMHVSSVFFLPQFVPLGLLIFWMVRVRLAGWCEAGNGQRPARNASIAASN